MKSAHIKERLEDYQGAINDYDEILTVHYSGNKKVTKAKEKIIKLLQEKTEKEEQQRQQQRQLQRKKFYKNIIFPCLISLFLALHIFIFISNK